MTGEQLRQWRKDHGLTQKQFAERFPVSIWTLKQWEGGRFSAPDFLIRALRDFDRELKKDGDK
jgi:putative transcriptional regulator